MFAEQIDYKMEIDSGKDQENNIKIVKVDNNEEEHKNAFKKKLRKYSCQVEEADKTKTHKGKDWKV